MSAAVDQRRFGALAQELGPAATLIYDSIAATVGTGALDDLSRAMWARYADGEISDDEATYLGSLIDRRRPAAARERLAGKRSCVILRFPKRKPQRAPERQQAYERRHRLAYSGVMPRHLAAKFTIGEMACLRIVGDECKAKGRCDVTLSEIAARAGVCRKTAKRAMDKAGRWGERLIEVKERPREGRKHLPNVVRIVSKDWIAWLARRSAAKPEADEQQLANGSATISQAAPAIGGQIGAPTDNILNDDYTGRARERSRGFANVRDTEPAEGPESGPPISGGDAAPCPKPSPDAIKLAAQVAVVAGHRLSDLPRSWTDANPELVVQAWLNVSGWTPADVLKLCQAVMRQKKTSEPPFSPRYFSREVNKQVEALRRPLPVLHGRRWRYVWPKPAVGAA